MSDETPTDDRSEPPPLIAQPDDAEEARESRIRQVGRTAWALLGVLAIIVLTGWLAGRLSLLVVPLILALFPATLLVPVAARLRSWGLPSSLAALATLLLALVVIGGLIWGIVALVIAEGPQLVESASNGVQQIERWLAQDPLGVGIDGTSDLFA